MRRPASSMIALIVGLVAVGMVFGASLATASSVGPFLPPAQGAIGAKFAVVNSDGTLARGRAVLSSTRLGTGTYKVLFNKNIANCAYVATQGSAGFSQLPAGMVTVAGVSGATNGVFIATFNSVGLATDEPFHLEVMC